MSEDKMRAEFEAWLNSQGLESKWQPERNAYEHFVAHFAYRAWVDSRAALVVELPPKISEFNTDENGFVNPAAAEHDEAIDDCRSAIEAAGVRVKP
jgi:hypothetical protein